MPAPLSASLIDFIHLCVPTYQAAEVLLFLAAHPDRDFSAEEIVVAMRPVAISLAAVTEHTSLFVSKGLIKQAHGRYTYGPGTAELARGVVELAHAYNERPVTLIRFIYRLADSTLQSFADSFKLRED